jgi:hypothetical protein
LRSIIQSPLKNYVVIHKNTNENHSYTNIASTYKFVYGPSFVNTILSFVGWSWFILKCYVNYLIGKEMKKKIKIAQNDWKLDAI